MPGDADVKIVKAFRDARVPFTAYGSWREAVLAAVKASKKGDTILFSPGCTSFGEFKNEFDRGEKFNALIKKYGK
jgi:UDP-N-acetylmuramoylalanine-D-glutamate ligase